MGRRSQLAVLLLAFTACSADPVPFAVAREARVAAQGYDVRILRDTWGVPHVFGRRDADAAFGLAYAHAEDDFEQIQESLLAARGALARARGPEGAPVDYTVQLLRLPEILAAGYEQELSPATREMLRGYADGVNYYAALHQEEALPGLFPVHGKDVAAGFLLVTPSFMGLPQVLEGLLAEDGPGVATREAPPGSNAFAVAPSRAPDGSTRLVVNSHQPWQGPVAWYEAHVVSEEGLDVAGGVFPGAPFVLHGHNRDLGWGFTVNRPDLIDVYRLRTHPDDPDLYLLDGRWERLEKRTARLPVRLAGGFTWTFARETLLSEHGPVVRAPHGTYAIRYAGWGDVRMVEQWSRLGRARNLQEWKDAMRMGALPGFNAVYADRAGNVFYVYNAMLPRRAQGPDWREVVPGDRSDLIWSEYLPFDELPQVENPPSGFVQSCNNEPWRTTVGPGNPDPADFPERLGVERRTTNRMYRALELLGDGRPIDRARLDAIKWDMSYSRASDQVAWVARAIEAETDDPLVQQAQERLRGWDRRTDPENRLAALGVLTLRPWVLARLGYVAERPEPIEALAQAAHGLFEAHGRLDPEWREVNRLRIGDVDLGLGGGPDVLHAVYAGDLEDGRRTGRAGDSLVLMVEWGPDGRVASRSVHQYGNAMGRPDSPHYADQAPLFVERRFKPVWLDEAEIRENLEREYRPGEE